MKKSISYILSSRKKIISKVVLHEAVKLNPQFNCMIFHKFPCIFTIYGHMTNSHDQPPVGLISSVGGALYQYHRGHAFKSCWSLIFFSFKFIATLISCLPNCDDYSCLHICLHSSKICTFIYRGDTVLNVLSNSQI